MRTTPRTTRRWHPGLAPGVDFFLGLALLVGIAGQSPTHASSVQPSDPCALVTAADLQPFAAPASVADGVAISFASYGFGSCRYAWGTGNAQFKFHVTVNDASRMFSGMSPELIKQTLQGSVTAGTADVVIPNVGEAAVFRADSPAYVHATAYAKGRILQVYLDGGEARDKRDQVIALLTTAASRL